MRFYGVYLPNFVAVNMLMILAFQLKSLDDTGLYTLYFVAWYSFSF